MAKVARQKVTLSCLALRPSKGKKVHSDNGEAVVDDFYASSGPTDQRLKIHWPYVTFFKAHHGDSSAPKALNRNKKKNNKNDV
jgi:hypothetical protein